MGKQVDEARWVDGWMDEYLDVGGWMDGYIEGMNG